MTLKMFGVEIPRGEPVPQNEQILVPLDQCSNPEIKAKLEELFMTTPTARDKLLEEMGWDERANR